MDNFTYTRHRKKVCWGKWRISAEFVWKNIYALKYHNPLVGGPNPSAATRIQAGFIPVLILSDKGLRIRYFSINKRI